MKPFVPDPLPIRDLDVARLICKVGPANAAIARYDGLLQSVVNYRKTLIPASEALAKGPVDLRRILQMHSVLMDSVRGSRKSPGQFRTEQNWIGPGGCTIEEAKFVPAITRSFAPVLSNFRAVHRRR